MPLEKRQIILSALSKAAKKLAENPEDEIEEDQFSTDSRTLKISAKLESQTRRWTSRPKSEKKFKCRFYPAAGSFLFPFLSKWDKNKRTLLLESADKDVLSRMIAFVGQIISLLDNIPEIEKYISPAIDFLATFRRIGKIYSDKMKTFIYL